MRFGPLSGKLPDWAEDYYNRDLYRLIYAAGNLVTYQLWNPEEAVLSFIHFFPEENTLTSLPGMPYGGFHFEEDLGPAELDFFLQSIQQDAQERGFRRIWINQPPDCYNRNNRMVHDLLQSQDFQLRYQAINHHLPVKEDPEAFEQGLHESEKRRLAKCEMAGFDLSHEQDNHVSLLFRFIERCREEQGRDLSLSENLFMTQFRAFPERYPLFAVWNRDELIAACISVQVSPGVLYAFYPAYSARFHTYSPMVMLYSGLYNYCRMQGIKTLDLGTSMLEGGPNQTLITFKERLGGVFSAKRSYQWQLL